MNGAFQEAAFSRVQDQISLLLLLLSDLISNTTVFIKDVRDNNQHPPERSRIQKIHVSFKQSELRGFLGGSVNAVVTKHPLQASVCQQEAEALRFDILL